MNELLVNIITALISGFIGTYFGSFWISKRQERKMSKTRLIAVKALNIIKKYSQKNKSLRSAENDFNTSLSVPEKRAIIVCLHKLGISVGIAVNETFNINSVCFIDKIVDKNTIDEMINQIKNGYCDNLFYLDPESQFSTNSLFTLRNVAKRYVTEVLSKSYLKRENNISTFNCESGWEKLFTLGELKPILIFSEQVGVPLNFDDSGKPDPNKMQSLLKDIDLGLFDSYLMWNYETYLNVKNQNKMVNNIINPPIKLF